MVDKKNTRAFAGPVKPSEAAETLPVLNQRCRILLADDEAIVRKTLGDYLKDSGHIVEFAVDGESAVKLAGEGNHDLALLDIRMPDMDGIEALDQIRSINPEVPVVMISGHGNMDNAVQAMRMGATDFLTKPVKLRELDYVLQKSAAISGLRRERRRLSRQPCGSLTPVELHDGSKTLIGDSPQTRRVRNLIRRVADTRCDTILLTGETGTGKEVVAREIHALTRTDDTPFVAVCCPALSGDLLESELFGHVKGAFTGADKTRTGYFEMAHGGTLFLDEVADLSSPAQATLLRVLETRRLRRVGGEEEIAIDVQIIAATNVSLENLIEKGAFRRDLFYRLNLFSIPLQPLRERRQDIVPLARHFQEVFTLARGYRSIGFSPATEELLKCYPYPGNGRELRNMVERAVILSGNGRVEPEHLNLSEAPFTASTRPADAGTDRSVGNATPEPVAHSHHAHPFTGERQTIIEALESSRWNRRQAARTLGIPYSTLRYKILKYNIC